MATWTKRELRKRIQILRERWPSASESDRKIIEAQARALKNALALKEFNTTDVAGDPEVKRIAKALF